MKKLFLLLALLGIVATGCSKDEVDKGNDNKTEQPNENEGNNEESPVFEVDSDGNYNVEAEGGEVLLAVTTNLEYSVYIPKDARSWIFYEETRAVRSETVVLSVEPNDNTELRTATIELRDAQGKALDKFNIIQKPKAVEEEEPVFEIDAEGSYTIPAEGAEIKVNITTNLEYRVEVSEDAKAWLSIGDTRAVRTETLIFTVAKNESDRERTATITIFNKDDEKVFEFRLTQKFNDKEDIPENIFFGLDKESVTISPDGGSVDVIVYSNYKWEISGVSDWCTPSLKNGGANEDGQKVTFSADVAYDDKEATFWFRCADKQIKFVVSQKLKEVIIPDENNTFDITAEGGVAVISYQTSVDCDVIIPDEAQDWITIAPATRGLVSENINLDIAENTTYSARTAVIKVVAKDNAELAIEYTINQEQNDAILADENNTFTVPCAGGEVVINYQTNIDCEVIIPEEAQDWITIAPATRGLVSENINLDIAENTTYSARTAVIKVVAKDNAELAVEYTINQEQNDAILANGNTEFIIDEWEQQITIKYQANVDCEVIIPDNAQDWVTIAPATRVLSTYNTTLNIAENNSGKERSCVIKVVSKDDNELFAEYTITQNSRYCLYYTSSNGKIVKPNNSSAFDATIVSNTYIDGVGAIDFNAPITTIGKDAFYYCNKLTSVTIPDSVTTIGDTAFAGCSSLQEFNGKFASEDGRCLIIYGTLISFASAGLTEYTIPDSVTSIGNYAFYKCSSLTSVTIPDSVTKIGDVAFAYCYDLTSVTIPDSVTKIGDYAFEDCSSLTSVTIGDSVTTIGYEAFYECISLTSVYCKPTTPPAVTLGYYGWCAFDKNSSGRKIYVPMKSVNKYKSASYWKNYADAIEGYNF